MTSPDRQTPDPQDESKDLFFEEVATLAERMIAAHGRDFAMGTLVLAARFIAEKKDFSTAGAQAGSPASGLSS
ncbi:hypothetical protein FHS55_000553 [Angulomicrobium tetraedrale]|uniref:Uncharacterized protein n=1 Tax=Ancylobacter tetraedralis TaxID=217068 RepID=A0A839Z8T4_9HYPH|nr:hypothetical protein [Ancylobacter tetraedralis]MBB3769967.1 hypothetical protein [Ancylobacter tetraedralis]